MRKVTPSEKEHVSSLAPLERYKYSIKVIADFESLWTLTDSEDGHFTLSSIEDHTLVPIWPAKAYLNEKSIELWGDGKFTKMDVVSVEKQLVPFLFEHDYLLNVFPVGKKTGFVVSAEEFVRDLNEELGRYI